MSPPFPDSAPHQGRPAGSTALLNQFVGVLDTKASMFLAGNIASATFLLKDAPHAGMVPRAAISCRSTCYGTSGRHGRRHHLPAAAQENGQQRAFLGRHRHPQEPRTATPLTSIPCSTSGKLDDQYLAQNYLTAKLLMRKYKCLRSCIRLFFVALFLSFTVFLMVSK